MNKQERWFWSVWDLKSETERVALAPVNIGITDRYRKTDYGEPVVALKSFIMSPFTDEAAVDLVVERVLAAQQALSG